MTPSWSHCSADMTYQPSAATKEDLREVAASLGFNIEPKYEADYLWLLQHTIGEIRTVTTLPEYIHPLLKKENKAEARTYTEAKGSENPLNAWRYRVSSSSLYNKGQASPTNSELT